MKKDQADQTSNSPEIQETNCGKCGLCLTTCPVFQAVKQEQASPRARLQLIKAFEKDELATSPLLKEIIAKCLMCGSCAKTCPSGINHYERFMRMRTRMVEELGEAPAIKALIYLLSKEFLLNTGSAAAAVGQRLTPDFIAKKYKVANIPLARFPRLNTQAFNQGPYTGKEPARSFAAQTSGAPKGRIAYFTGCATNYMFSDTGQAVVGTLTALGYEVILPKNQNCCALPMLFHGAADQAFKSIAGNVKTFSNIACDAVVVDCSTCGAALKEEYIAYLEKLQAQPDKAPVSTARVTALLEKAKTIAHKTADILSFVCQKEAGLAGALNARKQADTGSSLQRAIYHAPCHSRNSFNSHGTVTGLIKALPHLVYVPTPNEADCCGGGGTFFYEYPDLAKKIMDKKQAQVKESRADVWLTDCPVCRINIGGNLDDDSRIPVVHPIIQVYAALNRDPGDKKGNIMNHSLLNFSLEKGQGHVSLNLAQDRLISVLEGRDVQPLAPEEISRIIEKGIQDSAPQAPPDKKALADQTIAVIIPDHTRLWARGDLYVPRIISCLESLGAQCENIRVIIALGTHAPMASQDFPALCGADTLQKVQVLNSAGLEPNRLMSIGTTSRGTDLTVTKEAWEADHIIIFGGLLHHMLAGFGGGRKYILPGIAGEEAIQHNHSLAMTAKGTPHPEVRQAVMDTNPVNLDMEEGAALFLENKTCCYVAVAANGRGEIFYADAGPLASTFKTGCDHLDDACCAPISRLGDFALFSAGGHRTDGQLYQATKALFNAVEAVKEGSPLVFVAECAQGAGNPEFAHALKTYGADPGALGRQLAREFRMPAYVALRVIDMLHRYQVYLVSSLSEKETRELGFEYAPDIQAVVNQFNGKGYVIPYAENILPKLLP